MRMNPTNKKKSRPILGAALTVLAVLLAGGLYFIYQVLPAKVAQGIVAQAQVRKPITETPKDYGIPGYQDVSFVTSDGVTISGWWMPQKSPKKALGTILLSHGVFKNRQQVLGRAAFLWKLGYQTLLFDLRGSGESGPSPVSGGVLEANDYLAAEKFLESRHEARDPLVFFGFSLGAMSALRAAVGDTALAAVIADSPLANLKSYVSRRTIGGDFTALPGFLGACLQDYDQLTGLTLTEEDLDLLPAVEKLDRAPVLYITGDSDDLAKSDEVRTLFEHTPARHRRIAYIPDAGHEETFKKYPVVYVKIVEGFLTDLRNGFPQPQDGTVKPEDKKPAVKN